MPPAFCVDVLVRVLDPLEIVNEALAPFENVPEAELAVSFSYEVKLAPRVTVGAASAEVLTNLSEPDEPMVAATPALLSELLSWARVVFGPTVRTCCAEPEPETVIAPENSALAVVSVLAPD